MDLSKEKGCFLNKKGVSLAVFSAIFLGIFLFGIYFYSTSGKLTGNLIETQSLENFSCVGETKNFSCGEEITESCTLNGDLTSEGGCFNIFTNDIVLDCNGYSITGDFSEGYGINVENSENVEVKNCNVSGFELGISAFYSVNVNILESSLFNNNVYGVLILYSNDSYVSNSFFINNSNGGFFSRLSRNISILGNSFFGEQSGVYSAGIAVVDSDDFLISENSVSNYSSRGIEIPGEFENFIISKNYLFNNGDGIYLGTPINTLVEENLIFYNKESGIELSDSENTSFISNVVFKNSGFGIYNPNSNYDYFFNNSIHDNFGTGLDFSSFFGSSFISNSVYNNSDYGLFFSMMDDSIFSNNSIFENEFGGFFIVNSLNNSISNNVIFNNKDDGFNFAQLRNSFVFENEIFNNSLSGVVVYLSENNSFLRNNVYKNLENGIYLMNSSNNLINSNVVLNNLFSGIVLEYASNNTLINNSFIENVLSDISSSYSLDNVGQNNTCFSSLDWSDEGSLGCTYIYCLENWSCDEWGSCSGGIQFRTCVDLNNCSTELDKPNESQSCLVSGGSSGKSTTIVPKTAYLDFTSSFVENVRELEVYDKIEFFLKDSSSHNLELNRIFENRAYFTAMSDPVSFDLKVGEEKYLDLNKDKEDDFYIKLESLYSNKVSVLIYSIKDSKELEKEINSEEENLEKNDSYFYEIGEDSLEKDSYFYNFSDHFKNPIVIWVLFFFAILLLIIIFLLIIYFVVRVKSKGKNKNIKKILKKRK